MKIVVVLRQTVDLAEELELTDEGTDIEREYLTFKLNEWDEQALEEALLLAEETGGEVSVLALDEPEVDQSLYTALAKGAARAVKLTGLPATPIWSYARAAILAAHLRGVEFDLLLTGVQTPEDLDGQIGGILAGLLGLPHASASVGVRADGDAVSISQELAGGVIHELSISGAPAVIGVQTARRAPGYVPVARIRAAMAGGAIETVAAAGRESDGVAAAVTVRRMYAPQSSTHAEMLAGDGDAVAQRIVEIIAERGVLRGRSEGGAL